MGLFNFVTGLCTGWSSHCQPELGIEEKHKCIARALRWDLPDTELQRARYTRPHQHSGQN